MTGSRHDGQGRAGGYAALCDTVTQESAFRPVQYWSMDITWSVAELMDELERFEREARAAGLKEASVRTYVDRSRIFVRWLAGDYEFKGPR